MQAQSDRMHPVQGAMPLLAETKGCIVNISSVGAHRPDPGMTSYCVSKAGVDMLTRSSAQELAGKVRQTLESTPPPKALALFCFLRLN